MVKRHTKEIVYQPHPFRVNPFIPLMQRLHLPLLERGKIILEGASPLQPTLDKRSGDIEKGLHFFNQ